MRPFTRRITEEWVYPILNKNTDKILSLENDFKFLGNPNNGKPLQLYFHIPFCTSFCIFCPYYKELLHNYSEEKQDAIFDKYEKEMYFFSQTSYFKGLKVNAIQFGGGTPSCIKPEIIYRLIRKASELFDLSECKIISMEANVKDFLDIQRVKKYYTYGINRVSFGVQTSNERIRKQMGIKTTFDDVKIAIKNIEECGYEDYSFDLIYNLPNQTIEDLERDMLWASQTEASFIDLYNLNIFPNTLLKKRIDQEKYYDINPSNEREVKMARYMYKCMKKLGYYQVAANTFSKKHKKMPLTLYNSMTTNNYLGVGPTARSFLGNYIFKNSLTIKEYAKRVDKYGCSAYLGHFCSPEEISERELVFFPNKLRIDINKLKNLDKYKSIFNDLVEAGFVEEDKSGYSITLEGAIWAGNISQMFFSKFQRKKRNQILLESISKKENPYNQDKVGVVEQWKGK